MKNKPAFPLLYTRKENQIVIEHGMSERTLVAAMALQGILAGNGHDFKEIHKEHIAKISIAHADELLKQLDSE